MDKLSEIFMMQTAFDDELIERRHLESITMEEWMQKETIALIAELMEMLSEVNYKWWKNPKEINMDAVKEELVDVLHFFVSMCHKAGMDADELHARYLEKNKENFDRQHGRSKKPGYEVLD
ncbi:MAG: dUTPase [Clostridiales bacterium]|nr:dUTPase [Clostridiales bacterium]